MKDISWTIYNLNLFGLDEHEVAEWFGIDLLTLRYWMHNNISIAKAAIRGRVVGDVKLAQALHRTALKREHYDT